MVEEGGKEIREGGLGGGWMGFDGIRWDWIGGWWRCWRCGGVRFWGDGDWGWGCWWDW